MTRDTKHYEKLAQEVASTVLPAEIERLSRNQKSLINALHRRRPSIFGLPNVLGIGVGYHWRGKKPTQEIGPIVYVSKKVPAKDLRPKDRLPKTVTVRRKRYRIDVLPIDEGEPLCLPGIPDTQHRAHDPIPPDVAFRAYDPDTGLPLAGGGSGGAIVREPGGAATYLLSNRHVLYPIPTPLLNPPNPTISQPWDGPRIVGEHLRSSQRFDAALAEIQSPEPPNRPASPPSHCFGPIPDVIEPLVGMNVKKSGARTGVTGSTVMGLIAWNRRTVSSPDLLIRNRAAVPAGTPPGLVQALYLDSGDSGSMSLTGSPFNPFDFGQPILDALQATLNQLPATHRTRVHLLLLILLTNRAVGLNWGKTRVPGPQGAWDLAIANPAGAVLRDLGVELA